MYCDTNAHRFTLSIPDEIYTVGGSPMVFSFFEEFVFNRQYIKSMRPNEHARVQISLDDAEDEESGASATLAQSK